MLDVESRVPAPLTDWEGDNDEVGMGDASEGWAVDINVDDGMLEFARTLPASKLRLFRVGETTWGCKDIYLNDP
jgi:hypothetical protein